MGRNYPFLHFQPGVDWQHVNKALLRDLNALGAYLHETLTVISGYRTYAEQAALYRKYLAGGNIAAKPGHSEHEVGLAADVLLNGKALSLAVSKKTLARFGLVAPVAGDYPHIQLLKGGKATGSTGGATPSASADQGTAATDATQPSLGGTLLPATNPSIADTQPGILPPGSVSADGFSPRWVSEQWNEIASQPGASADSQRFAQLAAGGQS